MPRTPERTPVELLLKRYLKEAIRGETGKYDVGKTGKQYVTDREAVAAAKGVGTDRVGKIQSLLSYYGVFQGIKDWEKEIVDAVVSFFEQPTIKAREIKKNTREADCLDLFAQLSRHIYRIVLVLKQENDGRGRKLTSLLSKALWCRFPEHMPIYDRNAFVAINSLKKLSKDDEFIRGRKPVRPRCEDQTEIDKREYQIFIKSYFALYNLVETEIEDAIRTSAKTEDAPRPKYPIRVFDQMLWFFGSSSTDIPHKKEVFEDWRKAQKDS